MSNTGTLFVMGNEIIITDILDRQFKCKIVGIVDYNTANLIHGIDAIATEYEALSTHELDKILPKGNAALLKRIKFYLCKQYLGDNNTDKSGGVDFVFWDNILKINECHQITKSVEFNLTVDINTFDIQKGALTDENAIKNALEMVISQAVQKYIGRTSSVSLESVTKEDNFYTRLKDAVETATVLLTELSGLEATRGLIQDLKSFDTIENIKEIKAQINELYANAIGIDEDDSDISY